MMVHVRSTAACPAVFMVAITLLFGSPAAQSATATCIGDKPESVLDCLVSAYTARDSLALSQLLAEDFQYCFQEETNCFGRDEELKASGAMFRAATSVRLEVTDTPAVTPGDVPDTWILSGPQPNLVLETVVAGEVKEFRTVGGTAWFWVRRIADPDPHFVIFRMFFHDPN